jgi:multidrug efflux pump subunit AcrA (membrane-fusion protein)
MMGIRKYWFWMGSLMLFLGACNHGEETVRPQLTDITESVYASVTVQPKDQYQAFPAVAGILVQNLVSEGDIVKSGQPIAQIDNSNPELSSKNARLSLDLAQQNLYGEQSILKELEAQIQSARLKMRNDSINYERQKALRANNIGSESDFDARKLAFETSKENLGLLQARLRQTRNQLKVQLEQARNNYEASLNTKRDFTVTSQMDGRVYELTMEAGELVSQQQPIALIGNKDTFILELLVDEVDIARIQLHQTVIVRLDAYKTETFKAQVSKIYPSMDVRSQSFKIEAVFRQRPPKLYPGLTGEANIIIQTKENVLTIPQDYRLEDNKVRTKAGEQTVQTGLENFERIEILEGLDTSTVLLKP